ncbi:NAD(P)-binding protein [Cryphonectria parasitica EP155]|uniref:NAD(P)-binding protein n=1 Tax=Cryphonectria parasitica (strain ATCC 38755 / EP155) TaxID=660469 RepID=A0A9P4Y080_CRYP1|nr:NAD(P)-binding protein [Cryphonectria parasitica EP155]KAF3764156.1 NAD(P)-binding protein [Cryphonectria parasitica EP155]
MPLEPGQKTVLITGCSPGGIGNELCKAFHDRGLHVIATARNPAVLADFVGKPGFTCLQLDVTNEKSISACVEEVATLTGGTLDILVNNAGRTHTVPATDLDMDEVRETFEANVFGVMAMVKGFIHQLISAHGLIINISSASSIVPYPFAAAYSASKCAVNGYSRTLRQELRPYGVRVMVAITGTVRTNINLQTARQLPENSLYRPIEDIYRWRLTFSRTTPSSVEPADYARTLVADALRPEWPVFLRGILGWGRPDWHYAGGLAKFVWFGSCVGEWLLDTVIYPMFKLNTLETKLKQTDGQKLN